MKIHELAKMSGINPETIRSYRIKGILHPQQLENGYYEYSNTDFAKLVYFKKLRGFSFSGERLTQMYHLKSVEEQISMLEREEADIQLRINALQQQLANIRVEKEHFIRFDVESEGALAQEFDAIDERYDFYNLVSFQHANKNANWDQIYSCCTLSLCISKEILNGDVPTDTVPLQVGIGTYRHLLEQNKINIPADAYYLPNGHCVSQLIIIDNLDAISIDYLKPMMDYAKEHHYRFTTNTTSYIVAVRNEGDKTFYYFRIRALVEKW